MYYNIKTAAMVESAIEGLAICTTRKQRQGQWLSGRIVAYTDCTDYTLLRSHYGGNDPVGRTDKLYIVNLVTQNTIHTSTNLLIGNTIVLKKNCNAKNSTCIGIRVA